MVLMKIISFFVDVYYMFFHIPLVAKKPKNSGGKEVIVIVPGFRATKSMFYGIQDHLQNKEYKVYLPYFDLQIEDVNILADKLNNYLKKNSIKKCIFVSHSLGGLIILNLCERYKFKPSKIITISTPFYGSYWAYLVKDASAKQIRNKSDFIKDFKEYKSLKSLKSKMICIYSPYDEVVPISSSVLEGCASISVKTLGHLGIAFSEKCYKAIDKVLNKN